MYKAHNPIIKKFVHCWMNKRMSEPRLAKKFKISVRQVKWLKTQWLFKERRKGYWQREFYWLTKIYIPSLCVSLSDGLRKVRDNYFKIKGC